MFWGSIRGSPMSLGRRQRRSRNTDALDATFRRHWVRCAFSTKYFLLRMIWRFKQQFFSILLASARLDFIVSLYPRPSTVFFVLFAVEGQFFLSKYLYFKYSGLGVRRAQVRKAYFKNLICRVHGRAFPTLWVGKGWGLNPAQSKNREQTNLRVLLNWSPRPCRHNS
jgi:hypothetical protein